MKKYIIYSFLLPFLLLFSSCASSNTKNTYTVEFDSQGGSIITKQVVEHGSLLTPPLNPTRSGYTLSGWYKDSSTSDDTVWNFKEDIVTSNLTLYAGWEINNTINDSNNFVFELENDLYTLTDYNKDITEIIIPSEYQGKRVSKIKSGVFQDSKITSVTIPDSVEIIEENAFNNCYLLESVSIGTKSMLHSIGDYAFSNNSSLNEIYLPFNLTTIGENSFYNCGGINRFIIADGNLNYYAEDGHLINKNDNSLIRGANNTHVPSKVKALKQSSFKSSSIKELYLPSTINRIENYFMQDSNIEKITYYGIKEEFDLISKETLWNYGKENIVIEYQPIIKEEINSMYITINNNKLEVEVEKNVATEALINRLEKSDISFYVNDYGNFEKVGNIGFSLPTDDVSMSVTPGDVVLYQGNQISMFYGNNSWSYTKLGRINGYSDNQIKTLLGAGNGRVEVTISLL